MGNRNAIVIGAGIVGIATARVLAMKGFAVDVYERSLKASGASVRNFGMVWPIGQPSGTLNRRAIRSRNCWREIGDAANLWYDPVGSLHLAYNNDEWQVIQELFEAFRNEGREVSLLSKQQVMKKSSIAKEKGCLGGLYSAEELIVDPREAISFLPEYFTEKFSIKFHWGKAVSEVRSGEILVAKQVIQTDVIFICSGSDFETLYPEVFKTYPLTKCKLQMMRLVQKDLSRIGPALCGGLSLIHYQSFKTAVSLGILKQRYDRELKEFLKLGIHVMVSQNHLGHLTVGDSHEYGLSPDPFDRKHINDMILQYLRKFCSLQDAEIIESWNGVYGKLTNDQTELFFLTEPGVYIMNGVGGAGMTMSFGLTEELLNDF